ncbi:molybdopterin-dependent oxidoreductase [Pseudooceanicola sp. C21-150M6]|uniref:molybdopterin-dependent oxidoreductase n=1 Tax=Pseudooceanicola sp. C21-150M6 TaxID=3434355 RepID=UPI003D7F347C
MTALTRNLRTKGSLITTIKNIGHAALCVLVTGVLIALGSTSQADTFTYSDDDPLRLTVMTGRHSFSFSDGGLRGLPAESFSTTTIWTEGTQHFTGVSVAWLLDYLDIDEGRLQLTAANAYQITIPVEELMTSKAILAYDRNGRPMTLRDKGPLWLVYPYDSGPEYQNEKIYANSIWQLEDINVVP